MAEVNKKHKKTGRPPKVIKPIPLTPEKLGELIMKTLPLEQWADLKHLDKEIDNE